MLLADTNFSELDRTFQVLCIVGCIEALLVVILNATTMIYLIMAPNENNKKSMIVDKNILISLCVANTFIGITFFSIDAIFMSDTEKTPVLIVQVDRYLGALCCMVSFSHVLLLTIERFISIKYPLYHRNIKSKNTIFVLCLVWLVSALPTIHFGKNEKVFFLTFGTVILCCNIFILLVYTYMFCLFKRKNLQNTQESSIVQNDNGRTLQSKSIVTCVSIVLTFMICTVPPLFHLVFVRHGILSPFSNITDFVMILLLLGKSLCDPLVYILRNKIYDAAVLFLYKVCLVNNDASHEPRAAKRNNSQF